MRFYLLCCLKGAIRELGEINILLLVCITLHQRVSSPLIQASDYSNQFRHHYTLLSSLQNKPLIGFQEGVRFRVQTIAIVTAEWLHHTHLPVKSASP